jgi:hypothetical protein
MEGGPAKDRGSRRGSDRRTAAAWFYRELVVRARNLDELFVGLPPPGEAECEEVRSALPSIEGIRADLSDLVGELDILRHVIEKLQEAQRETEKIAPYRLVGAEPARGQAESAFEAARIKAERSLTEAAQAENVKPLAAFEGQVRSDLLPAFRQSRLWLQQEAVAEEVPRA